MISEAGPRPWKWDDNADGQEGWLAIYDAEGRSVAGLGDMEETDGRDLVNADLIVTAVNHYDALRAAARAVVEAKGAYTQKSTPQNRVAMLRTIDALRAALEEKE